MVVSSHDFEISDSSFLRELFVGNVELEKQQKEIEVAARFEEMQKDMASREEALRVQSRRDLAAARGEAARRHQEIVANLERAAQVRVEEQSRAASRAASIACESGVSVASTRARAAEARLQHQTIEFEKLKLDAERRDREAAAVLARAERDAESVVVRRTRIGLIFDGGLVYGIATYGAMLRARIPRPHCHGVPFLDFESRD
jgi:hypothetical protein